MEGSVDPQIETESALNERPLSRIIVVDRPEIQEEGIVQPDDEEFPIVYPVDRGYSKEEQERLERKMEEQDRRDRRRFKRMKRFFEDEAEEGALEDEKEDDEEDLTPAAKRWRRETGKREEQEAYENRSQAILTNPVEPRRFEDVLELARIYGSMRRPRVWRELQAYNKRRVGEERTRGNLRVPTMKDEFNRDEQEEERIARQWKKEVKDDLRETLDDFEDEDRVMEGLEDMVIERHRFPKEE